jgi:hypothetical protein
MSNEHTIAYSSVYNVTVEGEFQEDSAILKLKASDYIFSLTNNPMYVTVDGQRTKASTITLTEQGTIQWTCPNIQASQTVCLAFASAGAAYGDQFGNFYGQDVAGDTCITAPVDPCDLYTVSEWSECTYQCVPEPEDAAFNLQFRERVYSTGCNQVPLIESQPCSQTFTTPCVGIILGGESNNECTNNCQGGIQPSGCFCGQDCEADDTKTCCQSFFNQGCINPYESDSTTIQPLYRYQFFPCWTPQVCLKESVGGINFDIPACDQPIAFSATLDGTCDNRPYEYSCACGPNSECALQSGDNCCSGYNDGPDSYTPICLGVN